MSRPDLVIRNGVRNLRWFFRIVWGWHDYDYQLQYDLFFHGLTRLRDHIAAHQHFEGWEREVTEIDEAVRLWRAFVDAEGHEEEERLWAALHDHLKANARGWWC